MFHTFAPGDNNKYGTNNINNILIFQAKHKYSNENTSWNLFESMLWT